MRNGGAYVVAGLLVLASVPIYMKVYERYSDGAVNAAVPVPPQVAVAHPPAVRDKFVMTRDESNALNAITHGKAKCVWGVVYRTSDHVIEPWPGHVTCMSDTAGNFYGVSATGHVGTQPGKQRD